MTACARCGGTKVEITRVLKFEAEDRPLCMVCDDYLQEVGLGTMLRDLGEVPDGQYDTPADPPGPRGRDRLPGRPDTDRHNRDDRGLGGKRGLTVPLEPAGGYGTGPYGAGGFGGSVGGFGSDGYGTGAYGL